MTYRRKAIGSLALATLLLARRLRGSPDRTDGTDNHHAEPGSDQPGPGHQFSDAGRAHRPAGNAPAGGFRRHGTPSEPAVTKFVNDVATASSGNITIAPTFGAGAGTVKGFELGVADLVQRGETDLAVVSSRAWDLAG